MKDNPQLIEPHTPRTSKLVWRYFEANKIRTNSQKGTGTKMAEKLNNLTEKIGHFCSCAFMQIFANLEFIPINFIAFKVPPVQF